MHARKHNGVEEIKIITCLSYANATRIKHVKKRVFYKRESTAALSVASCAQKHTSDTQTWRGAKTEECKVKKGFNYSKLCKACLKHEYLILIRKSLFKIVFYDEKHLEEQAMNNACTFLPKLLAHRNQNISIL